MLDREIDRMQRIDRVKVANARNSFMMSDNGQVFPSIDVFAASQGARSTLAGSGTGNFADDQTQASNAPLNSPGGFEATHRNIVTANEMSGVCERFPRSNFKDKTGPPSQR